MNRGRKKSYLISAVTLALLFAAFLLVFRDALPEILTNLRTVPFRGVLLLLVLGFAYEGMEAAVGFVLLRRKKKDVRFADALNTTFLSVFGNIATMGAGTLPMQSFYLYRRGLDAGLLQKGPPDAVFPDRPVPGSVQGLQPRCVVAAGIPGLASRRQTS